MTTYQEQMAWARKEDANRRYQLGVSAIVHAIYLREATNRFDCVLYHIRGTCDDNCRWCKIG